jgi:hypothetical protein
MQLMPPLPGERAELSHVSPLNNDNAHRQNPRKRVKKGTRL